MSPNTEPVAQSFLGWLFSSLRIGYTILLPLAGLICFLLALTIVMGTLRALETGHPSFAFAAVS